MAEQFFKRVGTKIGGVIGRVQRSEYDVKVRGGIQRYDQSKDQAHKMVDDVIGVLPTVNGLTKSEKLAQTLLQTSNLYGSDIPASAAFKSLADALQSMGKEERAMKKAIKEQCIKPLETFYHQTYSSFKQEKDKLDARCLDMDGARSKNQKNNTKANQQKETEATCAFNAQRQVVESWIDHLPNQYEMQRTSMKAFAQIMLDLYTKQAELMTNALNAMG